MEKQSLPHFPAAVRVVQTLQSRITQGDYPVGGWLPAERDLAAEFAVSRPVIRAALSQLQESGMVFREPGCRPRVSEIPAEHSARNTSQQTELPALQTIAAVIPQLPTYVSAHAILRGISQVLQQKEAPYRLMIFDTHPSASPLAEAGKEAVIERALFERIEKQGVAGIILWNITGGATVETLLRLRSRGIPLVFIDRYPQGMDCDFVGVDNRCGVRLAVDHLLEAGHRRIGYVSLQERVTTVLEREEGYREAFWAHGLCPAPELLFTLPMQPKLDMEPAFAYFQALEEPPTAVVTLNDLHAFALIGAAQTHGVRVPEDLSVVGFDDIESYSPHPATLTTVHQPFYEIGQRAAELLLRRLAAPSSPIKAYQQIILSSTLVLRSTCRPLAGDAI